MNLNTAMGRRKDDELTRLYPSGAGDNLTGYSNGRGTGSSNVVPSRYGNQVRKSACDGGDGLLQLAL